MREKDLQDVADELIEAFDGGIAEFYSHEDSSRGYIVSKDRSGNSVQFPLIAISMAGVIISGHSFSHYLEISNKCTELKKVAKETRHSILVMERRKS